MELNTNSLNALKQCKNSCFQLVASSNGVITVKRKKYHPTKLEVYKEPLKQEYSYGFYVYELKNTRKIALKWFDKNMGKLKWN